MAFKDDIRTELKEGERLLYTGKPKFLPFWISSFLYIPIGLFMLIFIVPYAMIFFGNPSSAGMGTVSYIIFAFYAPLYFAVLATLLSPVFSLISYYYENYAVTDRRILIQSGTLNIETANIYFNQITHFYVTFGWQDNIFGGRTATIGLTTPAMPKKAYYVRNVEKPYEVSKMLERGL